MDKAELDRDKSIEPYELDVEWMHQADLFFKWSERAAVAKSNTDLAELELDTLKARLELQCRENPEKFSLRTVTENGVKAAVLCSNEYQAAYRKFLELRREQMLLEAARNSIDHKKRALEDLVKLHGQQYFAGPEMPRDLGDAWKARSNGRVKVTEEVNAKQRAKARQRRST